MECDFRNQTTYLGTEYACIARNLHTTYKNRNVTKIIGTHQENQKNENVLKFFVKFQNIPYLPHNIGDFFPNLDTYYVMKSNVQHLIPGDLDGLTNLKNFDVSHNPIELIPKNFFKGHRNIIKISFHDCHLKKIEHGAFEDLKFIEFMDLNHNDCFSYSFPGSIFRSNSRFFSLGSYSQDQYSASIQTLYEFYVDAYDKCTGIGRLLKEIETINNCKQQNKNDLDENYGLLYKLGLTVIIFLMIMIVFVFFIVIKIYNKYFKNNWNELNFNVLASSLNDS